MTRITSLDDLKEERYLIYKHSNRCLISARAEREVASLADSLGIPIYTVIVHDDRDLSQSIAETFGVAHQSPQVILIAGGTVAWHASHQSITAAAINEAVAGL
jgi:bacillithiol system protein YtxJ